MHMTVREHAGPGGPPDGRNRGGEGRGDGRGRPDGGRGGGRTGPPRDGPGPPYAAACAVSDGCGVGVSAAERSAVWIHHRVSPVAEAGLQARFVRVLQHLSGFRGE